MMCSLHTQCSGRLSPCEQSSLILSGIFDVFCSCGKINLLLASSLAHLDWLSLQDYFSASLFKMYELVSEDGRCKFGLDIFPLARSLVNVWGLFTLC